VCPVLFGEGLTQRANVCQRAVMSISVNEFASGIVTVFRTMDF